MNNYENYSAPQLIERIHTLESALRDAEIKSKVVQDVSVELANKNNELNIQLQNEKQAHQKQLADIRNPEGRYSNRLSWMGKVIYVIRNEDMPMRAVEIVDTLLKLDDSLHLKANPNTFISVVLAKAVKEKRLSLHKIFGTRGGYYALEEWLDEKGNLLEDIKEQLL
jgi:hypothetical protein